ncbi:hypothetical protein TorRG33x02_095800 [Trema orientale]|uniref:RNase H type-1 domain-containing protein n=1 Tax=Trema orientale TaxID=63057 RepID=A0A2P5F9T5_TREOI|nr:hypothetical protein TorRG33x02_095800 [Trema orientale]
MGAGIVVSESMGIVFGCASVKLKGSFSPHVVELLIVREGLGFAYESGLRNKFVESDTINANKVINSGLLVGFDEFIIVDIRQCPSLIDYYSVSSVPRLRNMVAHFLTKSSLRSIADQYWLDDFLYCISDCVLADFANL